MEKKNKEKEPHEPWYLMYLFLVPLFLIAIVPEGFFTWQLMLIFALIMSVPFVVMWWLYGSSSPRNKNKPPERSNAEIYIETLRRDNENRKKEIQK